MPTLALADAEELVAATLARCRTGADNARVVARALVAAEADGLKSHGLSRLPSYAAQAKVGKVDGFAVPQASRPRPGAAAIDAAYGFAFPALVLAEAILPEMARDAGIACAGITRSHHCGAAGHPVERLAEAGLVAMLFANTPAAIAPWGGAAAVFGTNPIAFACPLPDARADRRRSLALQGRARQYPGGAPEGRAHPRRLGARCGGQAHHRSRRRRSPAPCCRSAMPRARRWR